MFSVQYFSYPNLKNENPSLLKTITKEKENEGIKNKTEKHDHEKILKSLKVDNEWYKKSIKV